MHWTTTNIHAGFEYPTKVEAEVSDDGLLALTRSTSTDDALLGARLHVWGQPEAVLNFCDELRNAALVAVNAHRAAEYAEAERLACTGELYPINPDAPDEGSDVHHDGPCPIHTAARLAS